MRWRYDGRAAEDARRMHPSSERDLALLHVLGSGGLRRSEAAALVLADLDEPPCGGPAAAPRDQELDVVVGDVRDAKRGRPRVVPLDDDPLEAIVAGVKSRPPAATQHLLSMPRAAAPGPLGARDIARIVGDTPPRPICPRTAATRTFCATRSARTSPTAVPTPP